MLIQEFLDYRSSEHDAQDYLPRLVCQLVRSSKRLEYHLCGYGRGLAVLRVYIGSLFAKMVVVHLNHYYHTFRDLGYGVIRSWR